MWCGLNNHTKMKASKYKAPKVPMLRAWHLEAIKRRIDEGLRVRCINVETTLTLVEREGDRDKQHLELTSTPFNTVPVIHSAITIEEFGGSVYKGMQELKDGEPVPCVHFYVTVSARYEGNGTSLFTVHGQTQDRHESTIFFEPNKGEGDRDSVHQSDIERDAQ